VWYPGAHSVRQLPSGPVNKVYGGKGSNTACVLCWRRTIAWHEMIRSSLQLVSRSPFSITLTAIRIWVEEWKGGLVSQRKRRGMTTNTPR